MNHIRKITEKELAEMVALRRRGWTYQSLGFIYGVDHSSIYHLCKKYGAERGNHEVVYNLPVIVEMSQPVDIIPSILEVTIRRKPTSYLEYLKLTT